MGRSLESFKNMMKDVDKDKIVEMLYDCCKQNYQLEENKEHRNITQIELVFENGEGCELQLDMIEKLNIKGIKKDIKMWYPYKELDEDYSCEKFEIELNEKGLKRNISSYDDEYQSLEERLKTDKDIVKIIITYTDYTEQTIFVLWNTGNSFENKYQTIEDHLGNTVLKIGKYDT